MHTVSIIVTTVLALISVAPPPATAQAVDAYAFVNVNVIPMDRERVLENHTVIVRDGRIVALGPSDEIPVPDDATLIDAAGKYLIPGIAEMHAHIPRYDREKQFAENVLFLYLASGVTTVRGMLGHPSHLRLRELVETGEVLGPHIWTSGASVNGNSVKTVEAARRAATQQKAAGYDFIKIHPGLRRDVFDALNAAADDVGITFSGHVPTDVGIARALEAKYATIDHLDGFIHYLVREDAPVDLSTSGGFFGIDFVDYVDEDRLSVAAAATRAAGVWIVPTQILMESLLSEEDPASMARWPEMRYMPPPMVARWVRFKRDFATRSAATKAQKERFLDVRRQLVKAFHDEGVGLLLGSDAPQWWNVPGFSAIGELEAVVNAGLTPYQALATGTRNVAAFFRVSDRAGSIEVGKQADLILLDANPLENVGNLRKRTGVMIRGNWLSAASIQERLDEIADSFESR